MKSNFPVLPVVLIGLMMIVPGALGVMSRWDDFGPRDSVWLVVYSLFVAGFVWAMVRAGKQAKNGLSREDSLRDNSPLWRSEFRAEAPDHACVAEVNPAWEIYMGSPTSGTLCLSAGLHLERCSPVFLWSEDSRFLVVPQYSSGLLGLRQRLLVVDVVERWIYSSGSLPPYLQPESFVNGSLTVIRNPHRRPVKLSWQIPADLSAQFTRKKGMWAQRGNGQSSAPCVRLTGSTGD